MWSVCPVGLVISFISHIWSYHSLSRFFLVTVWSSSHPRCCMFWSRGSGSCLVGVWSFHCFCSGRGKLTWVGTCLQVISLSSRSCHMGYFSYLIVSLSFSFLPRNSMVTFPSTLLQWMITWNWFVCCWSVILPLFLLRTRYVHPDLILFWIWSVSLLALVILFVSHIWSFHSLSFFYIYIYMRVTDWFNSHPKCCKIRSRESGSCLVGVWSFHCFW